MNLNQKQLAKLKKALAARYKEVLAELRAAAEEAESRHYTAILGNDPPDDGDASTAAELVHINLAMTDREVQEIRDIEAARERMADGSYGICQDCGADIPFERLLAYPTARRCFSCQRLTERTYAHGGTPTL
jgi:RNA polymerase-binding protein DksA